MITTEIKAGMKYLCTQNLVNHIIVKVKKQSVLLPLATLTVVIVCLLYKFKRNVSTNKYLMEKYWFIKIAVESRSETKFVSTSLIYSCKMW